MSDLTQEEWDRIQDAGGWAEYAKQNGRGDQPAKPSTWAPIDLTDALAGNDIEPPDLMARSDGLNLIYRDRVHWFQGESESCKSWAAQTVVADELNRGVGVLYLDYEDDERGVVARLRALGCKPEAIGRHLRYVRPDEPLMDRHGRYNANAWRDFGEIVGPDHYYSLCVIDGVTEAMTTEGLELISNADVASWMRLLPKRIAGYFTAVVCIDHVVKDRDGQGRYAIGGQHKLAGVTGAAYKFTLIRPFSRCYGDDPVEGMVAVTVVKDRPGYVRARAFGGHQIGTLALTAYPDGGVTAALDPPGRRDTIDITVAGRILTYLAAYDGSSQRKIEENVEGKGVAVRESLRWLTDPSRGWIHIEKKGQSHLHWLTDLGRSQVPET